MPASIVAPTSRSHSPKALLLQGSLHLGRLFGASQLATESTALCL